jgi:endonuclease YncB( thermonuclease family)
MINRNWFSAKTFTIGIVAVLVAVSVIFLVTSIGRTTELTKNAFISSSSNTRVIDGDTFVYNGEKCRLLFIDAPEKDQKFGKEATDYLSALMIQATTYFTIPQINGVAVPEVDKYGRKLVLVMAGLRVLQEDMVGAGLAWVDRDCNDPVMCTILKRREKEARDAKRGLWADEAPTPPWEFRKDPK